VVYSISMVVFLSAIGVLIFDETLNARELTGLVLAVLSLVLLAGAA
jgi:multidrug transporter EmrE-like cation transporter